MSDVSGQEHTPGEKLTPSDAARVMAQQRHRKAAEAAASESEGEDVGEETAAEEGSEEGEAREEIDSTEGEEGEGEAGADEDAGEEDSEQDEGEILLVSLNGQEVEIPIEDLPERLEKADEAEFKLGQLSAQMANIEAQQATAYAEKLNAAVSKLPRISEPDWAQEAINNPMEIESKKEQWDRYKATVTEAEQAAAKAEHEARQLRLRNASAETPMLIPAWRDQETRVKDITSIQKMLAGVFGQERQNEAAKIWAAADESAVVTLILRKAALYDELTSNSKKVTKKVKRAPKMLKSGPTKDRKVASAREVETLRAQHRESGSIETTVAMMRAKRKG